MLAETKLELETHTHVRLRTQAHIARDTLKDFASRCMEANAATKKQNEERKLRASNVECQPRDSFSREQRKPKT